MSDRATHFTLRHMSPIAEIVSKPLQIILNAKYSAVCVCVRACVCVCGVNVCVDLGPTTGEGW